jgi:hypothetical protein
MEAGGHSLWFERLLGKLGYELWTGDPAKICAKGVRKQRNDVLDADHILGLLVEKLRFVPAPMVGKLEAASRVKMNAQKAGALDSASSSQGLVSSFSN